LRVDGRAGASVSSARGACPDIEAPARQGETEIIAGRPPSRLEVGIPTGVSKSTLSQSATKASLTTSRIVSISIILGRILSIRSIAFATMLLKYKELRLLAFLLKAGSLLRNATFSQERGTMASDHQRAEAAAMEKA
jgi:hypothetical protein